MPPARASRVPVEEAAPWIAGTQAQGELSAVWITAPWGAGTLDLACSWWGHDLRCSAPFAWHGEKPAAPELRSGSELDLSTAAAWSSSSGALDSLDQPELEPESIAALLRRSLARS